MTDSAAGTRRGPDGVVAGLRSWGRSIKPDRRYVGKDALAGLPGAISSVPDGMASAVLVGVNPVYGLYASFAGPVAGGLAASTRLEKIDGKKLMQDKQPKRQSDHDFYAAAVKLR